jgi:hypothetical protein
MRLSPHQSEMPLSDGDIPDRAESEKESKS